MCYVRKECESSKNKIITSYDYNLLKPINKDVLKKINEYFDFHLSNRQIENIKIYEYSDKKSKNYEIYFKDKNCYVDTDESCLKITITHNNLFKMIYKSEKQNLVGTEIDKPEYDPEYFDEELFNFLQSREDIKEFLGFDYRDYNDFKSKAEIMNEQKEQNKNELEI